MRVNLLGCHCARVIRIRAFVPRNGDKLLYGLASFDAATWRVLHQRAALFVVALGDIVDFDNFPIEFMFVRLNANIVVCDHTNNP